MDLTHSFTVPSSVEEAWALFMDLGAVGNCFPGATVTEVTDTGFSGTVKVKLGPIALVYTGSGSFVERDEAAHRAVIEAKGKDKRGNGTAGATVTIQLSPDGDGARADVVTDLSVTGKPAQFGRGVMQDVSDKLLQAFVACVEQQLTAAPPAPSSGRAPDQATTAPSSGPAASTPAPTPAPPVPESSGPVSQSSGPASRSSGPVSRSSGQSAGVEDDALDLGSAVLPVLMRRYGGFAAAGIIGVLIGLLLGRRRRS